LERLSDRCLLSAVILSSATQTAYNTVSIDYEITSPSLSTLTVDIDRSSAPRLGGANQVAIGEVTLSGADVTLGVHDNVPLVLGQRASGVDALAIDPALPYVIAAATGPDGITSSASYQTITIGLVTHGFDSSDTAPAWIYQMAASLSALGYNEVIPFDWATASHTLQSGEAVQSGVNAAQMIENYINGTNSQGQPNVPLGDVVDIHLIGHSRGSVVITQAMQSLQDDLAQIPQAEGGYWELTYLDPHPSHGDNVAPFTATSQSLIDAANYLQEQFQDPYPLIVPSQVALAQVYYENTPVSEIVSTAEEGQIDPWGITYPDGIEASPGASTQFQTLNLTTPGMTHSGVYEWYQANVVPTLGTANPFVTSPIDPPIVANGENLSVSAGWPVANRFAYFSDLNPDAFESQYTATINWGDQSGTSSGLVVGTPDLGYYVLGLHTYAQAGTYTFSVTIQHSAGSMTTVTGTVNVTAQQTLTGSPPGSSPLVTLTEAGTGKVLSQFPAFPANERGGVRVAYADVNGDGIPDIVAATGRGARGEVRIFDGVDHRLIRDFFPFGPRYRGGIAIAAGYVSADSGADFAVGNASGVIKVYRLAGGAPLAKYRVPRAGALFRRGVSLSITAPARDGYGNVVVTAPNGRILGEFSGVAIVRRESANLLKLFRKLRSAHKLPSSSLISELLASLS
jgi:hypothetical protein